MWRRYFKLVKLAPGRVIVPGYGTLDFAGDVPVETCKALYEADFEFLEITEEGKRALYGIGVEQLEIKNSKLEIEEPATSNSEPETLNTELKVRHTSKRKKVKE